MLAAEVHRSTTWVWVVVGGFAISLVLLWHVVGNAISTLPDDIRDRLRGSLRTNSRPLAVTAVVLTWTLAYGLYSLAITPIGTNNTNVAASTNGEVGATTTSLATDAGGAASPAASSAGAAAASAAGGSRTSAGSSATKSSARSTASALGGQPVPASSIKEVNLYSGAANTRGITPDTITICGHAPLNLGQLINTKPEDLKVFWSWLNDHGGIYGRKFNVQLTDDQYSATGGVPAAQQCQQTNPFMIFGALGSDVIPPVRQWAEEQKELYLYGFSARAGTDKLKYSYMYAISQEDMSTVLADSAIDRYPGKKVGIVWRNSNNMQPGRDAFKKEIARRGGQVVADIAVSQNQGTYSQEIIELQSAGAEVVFMLDDAFGQTNFMKQAKSQQYNPNWLFFAFNLQTKTLGADSLNPPLAGANEGPAYDCHHTTGAYASYGDEIKVFEEAYAKYSPNTDLCGVAGDVAWFTWVGFKALAGLFQACGPDCTRNRFAGVMEGGFKGAVGASCPFDFSADPHHGQRTVDLFEAYQDDTGAAAWRSPKRCVSPAQ